MTIKTPIPIRPAAGGSAESAGMDGSHFAQWNEARLAYPLYAALATQFNLGSLPYPPGELPPQQPTREAMDSGLRWLHAIDEKVRAYQIRQLPPEILNASEEALRAFTQRHLRKPDKTGLDRDKIDLLLVQYFALCAPEQLYRTEIQLEDVAKVLQPVLTQADATPLDWCAPLDSILDILEHCQSLRDMMEHGLLEQGRLLKDSAGSMFYDPAALVAFCRFNFLLRRAFIRMLHADLSAIRHAVDALDAMGVNSVDCRRAGFSAAEPTAQIRYYAENWRQPFHKDYTANSVTRAFEQLLALRADLEETLARIRPAGAAGPANAPAARTVLPAAADKGNSQTNLTPPPPAAVQVSPPVPAGKIAEAREAATPHVPPRVSSVPPAAKKTEMQSREPVAPASTAELEKCLETIWEQLIAAPPSRGRSMSTVTLEDTKVLLSSWEVAAFVSEGDQEAEDLRRAVVARALVAVSMDARKRSGDLKGLGSALAHAKSEVSYFQGRVEIAKKSKNTEAAVNLGISSKRLLSFIEEAEKLQP
jgi:hypothetical protein